MDLITIQGKVEKFDIVEQCTQERQNTKWRFKLITNVTIFAALLKNIPMGCPDSVLPEPLLRHTQVNCLLSNKDKQPYKDHLCIFRALTMYLHGHSNLDAHTSELFIEFISKSGYDPKIFRGVSIDDLPVVEGIVERNIFIYDFDIQEGEYVGELARRSIGKFEKTVKLLRFNNHIIHTNDIDSFFKCFRCPSCDCFFNRSDNFNRHLLTCKDRVRHIYPKNVYTLRKTLFEKLDGFNIPVSKDNTLFNNLAIFDFESICVPSVELKATQTATWIGKHVPISVSISSNLIDEPIFLYNKDPQKLIIDFVIKLELLAEKGKLEMRTKFRDVERVVNERMSKIFQELNERCRNLSTENFEYEDEYIEDTEETDMSTQFLRMQKNQLIDLKQNLERYVKTLPVFGFNSGRYDLNLIKGYLIPYLINDKETEPMVIRKANDFISFKFGDIQFLDIMKFLGGATSLDSFLKAYKASETKGFFPYEWFDSPDKLESEKLPPYEAFFSKLRNNNPLDKDFKDYQNLKSSGLDEQQALKKLQIRSVPASGWDNYKYLQEIWQKHGMTTFKAFCSGTTTKMLFQPLKQCKKCFSFIIRKKLIC